MDETHDNTVPLAEWLVPLLFVICGAWVVWHMPAYILDWADIEQGSAFDQLSAQYRRTDVTPGLGGIFGGFIDPVDLAALLALPFLTVLGIRGVRRARMEGFEWTWLDKLSVFLGRVTMVMVTILLLVMLYEVLLRYVFERPTLWANELSLWIAGFVFLLSGLYAMQQRTHIRIFIVYDLLPRGIQKICDTVSILCILLFTSGLIYGGYGEAKAQFFRWETLGTAFDPPIPATLTPAILIVVTMVAIQAVSNLIRDWNLEPEHHSAADDIDQDEIERLRASVGSEGVGDIDVTRGSIQNRKPE